MNMETMEFLEMCQNEAAQSAFLKAQKHISAHERIYASISGGADSDIMLDLLERARGDKVIDYVFFDTGVEYQATRDHLEYLENRYGIEIKRIKYTFYGWHISDLKIYDTPKELSDFGLKRPPQSWCYVEEL